MQQFTNNISNSVNNSNPYGFSTSSSTIPQQQDKMSAMSLNYVLNNAQDDGNNRFNLLKSAAALLESNSNKNEPNRLPPLLGPNSIAPTISSIRNSIPSVPQNVAFPPSNFSLQHQPSRTIPYLPNTSSLSFPGMGSYQPETNPPFPSQKPSTAPLQQNDANKTVASKNLPTSTPAPTSTGTPSGEGPSTDDKRKRVHVSRACLNCRKAHACCGEQRPCQRCVRLGIANECVDVMNKKRHKLKNDPAQQQGTVSSSQTVSPQGSTPTSVSPMQGTTPPQQDGVQKPKKKRMRKDETTLQNTSTQVLQQQQPQQIQSIQQQPQQQQPLFINANGAPTQIPQLEEILARFQQKLYNTNGKMPTQEDLNTVSYLLTTYGGLMQPLNTVAPPPYTPTYPQGILTPSALQTTPTPSIPSTPNYPVYNSTPVASPSLVSTDKLMSSEKNFWDDDSFWNDFLAETFSTTGEAATPLKSPAVNQPLIQESSGCSNSGMSPAITEFKEKPDTPTHTAAMIEMQNNLPNTISAALLEHREEMEKRRAEMGVGDTCPGIAIYLVEDKKPNATYSLKNASSFEMSIYKNFKDYFDACDKESKALSAPTQVQPTNSTPQGTSSTKPTTESVVSTAELNDTELLKLRISKLEQENDFLQSKLNMANQLTQSLLGLSDTNGPETGLVVTVQGGGIVSWNTLVREKLGYDAKDLFVKVKSWRDLVDHKDLKQMFPKLVNAVRNRLPSFSTNYSFIAKNGTRIQAQATHRFCHDYKAHLPVYSVAAITFL